MGTDKMFEELGETISRTAKAIGEKADEWMELQKMGSRASGERRQIAKEMERLGGVLYQRYVDGEQMDLELSEVCDEITRHKMILARYEEKIAELKGKKVCSACGKPVGKEAAYCSCCGASCGEAEDKTERASGDEAEEEQAEAVCEAEDSEKQDTVCGGEHPAEAVSEEDGGEKE